MTAFQLRLPEHIMEQAKAAAAEEKTSVNQMLLALIAEGLGQRRGLKMLRERAARGNVEAALAILDRVPDVPPDEGDELPERAKKRRS
jgi:hypothetical protein